MDLGGDGQEGDLVVQNSSGDNRLHLDGEESPAQQGIFPNYW